MEFSKQELIDLDEEMYRYLSLSRDIIRTFDMPLKYKAKEHRFASRVRYLHRRLQEELQK